MLLRNFLVKIEDDPVEVLAAQGKNL